MMRRGLSGAFVVLLANTAYLAGWPAPSVFYMGNALLHLLLGLALAAAFILLLARDRALRRELGRAVPMLLLGSAAFGLLLAVIGNLRSNSWALWAHVTLGVLGVVWLAVRLKTLWLRTAVAAAGLLAVAGAIIGPKVPGEIRNPESAPLSMEEEGGGVGSPFWPSSANTSTGDYIPADYFLSSEKCAECHQDIHDQWSGSAHHFASFNNQFYRKAVEHIQEVSGSPQSSKWCAGCHDHAVLFSGNWERPIREQIDTPAAQAGLGCVSCHSIVHLEGTMGNGGFTLEYPEIHDLAASENPLLARLAYFLTFLEPEPHRRAFLKPFMKTSEYCSSCHKVHLDKPVNNYRWLRGFNSYDNWQASGVSGEGARSFYYPDKPLHCADCHMPLVPGEDPAARNGLVHSHRFAAANTALAHVNRDETQRQATENFLSSGFVTVDIFAASPVEDQGLQMVRRAGEGQRAMTTFAVGEEAQQAGPVTIRDVGEVTAPLDKSGARFRPGDTIRIDVVVRTRAIGHFFPTGTVDAFDVWVELKGEDTDGRTVFWSGAIEDNGEVDPGAHFYRSFLLDGAGNPIDKRNAWQARSVLYARLIPPGAADVVHYRLAIPADARGPIKLTASLKHRKFTHYYTAWAYAGRPVAGEADLNSESREWSLDPANIPPNVSGAIKDRIPQLPVTELASDEVTLQLASRHTQRTQDQTVPQPPAGHNQWTTTVQQADWERWNDWGIGLLLQGDLKGAEYAFRKATEADPSNPDGWLNIARALIREGEIEQAKPLVAKAKQLGPELARVDFFQAMAEKAEGEYETALASLERVRAKYPRDRVVLNQIGLIRFRLRDYAGSVEALRAVLAVDPEDLQAHYTLMLAYRGLGDQEASARQQKLFRRFKADESAQRLTARLRRLSPEDNNERQPIHDHVTRPLQ